MKKRGIILTEKQYKAQLKRGKKAGLHPKVLFQISLSETLKQLDEMEPYSVIIDNETGKEIKDKNIIHSVDYWIPNKLPNTKIEVAK